MACCLAAPAADPLGNPEEPPAGGTTLAEPRAPRSAPFPNPTRV